MSRIFIIMGKSATGKDTLFKKLIEKEELHLKTVVSYTTRPIRQEEVEGVEYHFVTERELKELQEQKKVMEQRTYDTIYGKWHYFTVDDGQIDVGKGDYLMIGTLESYEQIRNYYGKDIVKPIYLEVEDGLRLQRALDREKLEKKPKYAELCRRFLADEIDFSEENIKKLDIQKKYNNANINISISQLLEDMKP